MKNTHLKLLVVIGGLALLASCFLPALPASKRHATKIHTVNSVSSFSFSINTNALANRTTPKQ